MLPMSENIAKSFRGYVFDSRCMSYRGVSTQICMLIRYRLRFGYTHNSGIQKNVTPVTRAMLCPHFYNLRLIMRQTAQPYTRYTTYNSLPRRAAMTRHRLSRRKSATARFKLPGTDGAEVLPTTDQVGLHLANIHHMAPSEHTSDKQACYSFIDLGRMKG